MKKIFLLGISVILLASNFVGLAEAKNTYRPKSYHSYISGPRGGCYYRNSHNNKTYVDRGLCR